MVFAEKVGKDGEDTPSERNVTQLDVDSRRLGITLNDGEKRVSRERGCLVGFGVNDSGNGHSFLPLRLRDVDGSGNAEVSERTDPCGYFEEKNSGFWRNTGRLL